MNTNIKNPQMEHCPCPKHGVYKPDLYSLQVKKIYMKDSPFKYATTK